MSLMGETTNLNAFEFCENTLTIYLQCQNFNLVSTT